MAFDDKRYVAEVLEPARRAGTLPELAQRYQIDETMPPAEVVARVDEVRRAWRRARQQARFTTLVNRLTAEHSELEKLFEAARRDDAGPLRKELRNRRKHAAGRVAELVAEVVAIAGELGRITPQVLDDAATRHGIPLDDLEALTRAGIDGVEICEPDELPASAPIRAFEAYRASLQVLGHRHASDFLAEKRVSGASIFDRFAVAGEPRLRFDRPTLAALRDRWAERPRNERSTSADTIRTALQGVVGTGQDAVLRLLQYEIAEQLRDRRRGGVPDGMLVTHAVSLGIAPEGARRLVFAIRHEDLSTGASSLHRQLSALREAGQIYEAGQLVDTVSLPEDTKELAAEIGRLVAAAVDLRNQATDGPTRNLGPAEVDRRWRSLSEARRLVPDLPSVGEAMRRLVPAPPTDVRVAVSAGVVSVSWQASRSNAGDLTYQVIRQRDRPPANALDAELTVARTDGLAARDQTPRVNETLYYAVLTQRDGTASATLAVSGPVLVRPEPEGIRLHAGDGVVEGRWRLPAKAERVLVRRVAEGSPTATATVGVEIAADANGFRDLGVRNNTTYRYWIGAVYLDRLGSAATTVGTVLSATPTRKPEPVRSLRVLLDSGDAERLRLEFAAPEHGTVEIVELADRPQWPMGKELELAAARKAGTPVAGMPTPTGLTVRRPAHPVFYLALTVAGDMAVVGAVTEFVWVAPLTGLTARRMGTEVTLGWQWPTGLGTVEVGWSQAGEEPRQQRVTKASYQADGGVRLPADPAIAVAIVVRPVVRVGAEDRAGVEQRISVPGRLLARYGITWRGPPWRRWVLVEVSAEQSVRIERLVLGLRPGRVLPLRLDQCTRLGELSDVELAPDRPARMEIAAPSQARPYWLRCFVEGDGVELLDPPTDQLRRD
ncbi:MAG: hypothetical protein GEV28_11640 [Actinophytocola sp.]|uniref:hypothetical protein n=1 Tax=Actinophytocola sp. TaxID=1872138 RepID=UPI00132BEE4C|nr:hypothetical protein [Actinophytocola sp.]MPZ81007.1 hypothetical protein [Actinophytocola sp.]